MKSSGFLLWSHLLMAFALTYYYQILYYELIIYLRNYANTKKEQIAVQSEKELFKLHAEFCKFMANPKRIEILFLLGTQELCVEEIASKMEVKIPNISQHLAVMREKGVVAVRREGNSLKNNSR